MDYITIADAIDMIDATVPNNRTEDEKIAWLDSLDRMVKNEVFDTHEGYEDTDFIGYDENTSRNQPLLIPKPYAVEIYKAFLELQIHLVNKEYDRYNASSAQYSNHYDSFVNWWHCNHMPKEITHITF